MKILIIEDDEDKRAATAGFVEGLGVPSDRILVAKDMAEFMGKFDDQVSICVIDLRLPAYEGAGPEQNGIGILQALDSAGATHVKLLAISAYPEEFADIRPQFESRGCLLIDYDRKDVWQNILKQMILQVQSAEVLDFLIFCALRSERAPYTGMPELAGVARIKDTLTRYDVAIAGKSGTIIVLPRMGLVDAAVMAGRCIEKFKPRVVAMSGICAGFPDRAELGQLLVSELAYEYQSGKWTDDGFSGEPYQVPISEDLRVLTHKLLDDPQLLARLEKGWSSDRPAKMTEPKLALFTSGSAVIASGELIDQVAAYHRRVSGLDMEVYAVMRAAQIAVCKPDVLCAKTVVDLAGGDKNDRLHPYGCEISARFTVEALQAYFRDKG
jgi:nucleoside phosphorylase/CheY-like chemotaxis protein